MSTLVGQVAHRRAVHKSDRQSDEPQLDRLYLLLTAAPRVRRNVAEDGVVTRIDLEEIDLSAAPGPSARQIRAGKKNVAKILARGQSIPSWKRSLAAVRGNKNKRLAGPEGNLSRRTVR